MKIAIGNKHTQQLLMVVVYVFYVEAIILTFFLLKHSATPTRQNPYDKYITTFI